MSSSFLCSSSCGYAKVAAVEIARAVEAEIKRAEKEGTSKFRSRIQQEQFHRFNDVFKERADAFRVEFLHFQKKLPGIRKAFSNWNSRKKAEKQTFLEQFSVLNWRALSESRMQEHSFANCKGCYHRHSEILATFPVHSLFLKSKGKENPFATDTIKRTLAQNTPTRVSIKDAGNTAKALYDKINPLFEKACHTTFAKALAKSTDLELQLKPTKGEKKESRRKVLREVKTKIENEWKETSLLRYVI